MFRPLIIAALLASVATAAEAGGPAIAYVKVGGTAQEIYLVNPDGSAVTKVYAAPRKTSLGPLDLKPTGNEVAFTEAFRIKIQKFQDNGQPDGPALQVNMPCTAATGNSAYFPDYHPSGDGSFVFVVSCQGSFGVYQYTPGSLDPQLLFTTISTNRVRWNNAGTHLYYDEEITFNSGTPHLKRRDMTTGNVEDLGDLGCSSGGCLDSFDVTRTADGLVFGSVSAPKLLTYSPGATVADATPLCVVGGGDEFHYSPTDAQFIHRTPHSAKGDYILLRSSNCSGSPFSLTGKGTWGRSDWRRDPVTP